MDDPRFSHIATDPRFRAVPRKVRKVKVDPRFNSMFTDRKFKTKYHVDKRGRKIKLSSTESIKKYYDLDKGELKGQNDHNDTQQVVERRKKSDKYRGATFDRGKGDDDGAVSVEGETGPWNGDSDGDIDDEEGDIDNSGSDIGDGDGVGESASSSSESDLDEDTCINSESEIYHNWAEGDNVMETTEASSRLAVCNMDWDNVNAQDLYVLLTSFKPQKGVVHSVTIYPSDYGRERLEKEDIMGPAEIIEDTLEPDINPDSIEGKDFSREKLRQYQFNRLKYYYAIAECDSPATANHIYDQCDGLEYEYSASKLDLRFIPEDMSFTDREAVSMATEHTIANYKPSDFFTTALQQSNVKMTWDQTDPKRLKTTMRKFTEEDAENMAFDMYLASSSDDEGDKRKRDINHYRAILFDGSEEQTADKEHELEVTWDVGLNEGDKEDEVQQQDGNRGSTKRKRVTQAEPSEEEDLGFDDPFFTKDLKNPKLSKRRKGKPKLSQEEEERIRKEKEELELLVMSDSEDTRQHFSLKSILNEGKKESAKKKRKKRKEQDEPACKSDFKIDLKDPRFSALYESHLYAIDPSNPSYKSTEGMKAIIAERQERKRSEKQSDRDGQSDVVPAKDHSIGMLVRSIKSKTDKFHEKMKKRRQVKL